MVTNYFHNNIQRKKSTIYTRGGRWIFIAFILLICLLSVYGDFIKYTDQSYPKINVLKAAFIVAIPLITCCITFCLYLVPKVFKNANYRKFWIQFILFTTVCIFTEVVLQYLVYHQNWAMQEEHNFIFYFKRAMYNNIGTILGITSVLFFIEMIEEISLKREIVSNAYVRNDSLRKMQGTKMDLPFMTQSLRAIKQSIHNNQDASEMTLLFADVLRYKLYGYEHMYIRLEEEIDIIQQMISFNNYVIKEDHLKTTIDIDGEVGNWYIQKQSLLNLIHPFISNTSQPLKNLLIYILIDAPQVYVAIEFNKSDIIETKIMMEKAQANTRTLVDTSTFEINNSDDNTTTINACLTLKNLLNASS